MHTRDLAPSPLLFRLAESIGRREGVRDTLRTRLRDAGACMVGAETMRDREGLHWRVTFSVGNRVETVLASLGDGTDPLAPETAEDVAARVVAYLHEHYHC